MSDYTTCLQDLVIANRILAHENVVDAYGHVSVRHPDNPQRFLLSRSRSPELVTLDDIMEFTLDGDAVDQQDRAIYSERFIHGAVYESREDVQAVVHNHSLAVIPFSITNTPIRPVVHVAAPHRPRRAHLGYTAQVWRYQYVGYQHRAGPGPGPSRRWR